MARLRSACAMPRKMVPSTRKIKKQRRHHHERELLPRCEGANLEQPVAQRIHEATMKANTMPPEHGQDDVVGAAGRGPLHEEDADSALTAARIANDVKPRLAVGLAKRDRFERQPGGLAVK